MMILKQRLLNIGHASTNKLLYFLIFDKLYTLAHKIICSYLNKARFVTDENYENFLLTLH